MDTQDSNIVAQDTQPKPIWFYEINGETVPLPADHAWNAHKKGHKLIGHSDGKAYFEKMKEGYKTIEVAKKQYESAEKKVVRYGEVIDRLLYDELLDEEDEKVKRAEEQLEKVEEQLQEFKKKWEDSTRTFRDDAMKAEIEVAKGNLTPPPNRDFINPKNNPKLAGMENEIRGLAQ